MATKKQLSFVVDESKWLCGAVIRETGMDSSLHDAETGLECCLGQFSRQLGASVKTITGISFPSSLPPTSRAYKILAPIGHYAVRINDPIHVAHRTRKRILKSYFAKHGITITFTGSIKDAIKTAKAKLKA